MLQLHSADGSGDGAGQTIAIRREDYTAPAYWIDTVDLSFDLEPALDAVLCHHGFRDDHDLARLVAQEAADDPA
ncbi:hypothetical protein, partial [Acidovorax sp.]|uniref:hypothetical protein n=1 Tax=Acidovorax sp. TaxID=1872122 RepID=UPI0025C31425